MARIVILGAGISGHAAARSLYRFLGRKHEICVVSPEPKWNWIPSNILVGMGQMTEQQVTFDLAAVYKKMGAAFHQAKALSIHPEGRDANSRSFVRVQYTGGPQTGQTADLDYDYLINATGPKLNFDATEGLGPEHGYTVSVCTAAHALEANEKLQACIAAMRQGQRQTFVIGTGHGTCTCQGRPLNTSTTLTTLCAKRACVT